MVAAMAKEDSEDESKRVVADQITITNKNLEDFVSARSWAILHLNLDLNVDFLDVDPEDWELCKDFQDELETVQALNDHVECGMAISQEFCGHFTTDESQYSICCKLLKKKQERLSR